MKFLVSILAHEKPEIVRDQFSNIQRFLPDAAIVLHLHVNFDWQGASQDFTKLQNVFVNPVSLPTFWGNLHHAHNANFHYACSIQAFEYFLMHSSSDLFVRDGADAYMATADAGVSFVPPQSTWGAPLFAEGDPVFQDIMRESGAKELWCSQVEGTFYRREIFSEMLSIIERHFNYRNTLPYVHEEIYYPTIAKGLGVQCKHPYLLREDRTNLPALDAKLVDQIRAQKLPDHFIRRWKQGRWVDSKVWTGDHIYALRPVPRQIDHPVREYIRSLGQAA